MSTGTGSTTIFNWLIDLKRRLWMILPKNFTAEVVSPFRFPFHAAPSEEVRTRLGCTFLETSAESTSDLQVLALYTVTGVASGPHTVAKRTPTMMSPDGCMLVATIQRVTGHDLHELIKIPRPSPNSLYCN